MADITAAKDEHVATTAAAGDANLLLANAAEEASSGSVNDNDDDSDTNGSNKKRERLSGIANDNDGDGDGDDETNNDNKKQERPSSSREVSGGNGKNKCSKKRERPSIQEEPTEESLVSVDEALEHKSKSKRSKLLLASAEKKVKDGVLPASSNAATATSPKKKPGNTEQWDQMYQRLVSFKEKYGTCLVSKRWAEDPKLGTWVETQRVQKKKLDRFKENGAAATVLANHKRLGPDRLAKLEMIGFAWQAKRASKSKVYFGDVKDALSASITSPTMATTENNTNTDKSSNERTKRPLAAEIESAKQGAAAHNKTSMSDDEKWEECYGRLQAYHTKFGHCLVKRGGDAKLAAWVELQRALWNRDFKEGQQEQKLEEYFKGVKILANPLEHADPSIAYAATTETQVESAEVGAAADDTFMDLVPSKLPARQLTQERKNQLDTLGMIWSLRHKRVEDHWESMFQQLVVYKEEFGDTLVPSRYEPNSKLAKWIETQRYEYNKWQRATEAATETVPVGGGGSNGTGTATGSAPQVAPNGNIGRLTEARRKRLESIDFQWRVKNKMLPYYEKQWNAMYERLLRYETEHGHIHITRSTPSDAKLFQWVYAQRNQYKKFKAAGTPKKEGDAKEPEVPAEPKKGEDLSHPLIEARFHKLVAAGIVFSFEEGDKVGEKKVAALETITRNSYDTQWDVMYEKLAAFKKANGHCLVPKRYTQDPKLGVWCDTQRVQRKKLEKKMLELGLKHTVPPLDSQGTGATTTPKTIAKPLVGRLTDERIRKLVLLDFAWNVRDDWKKHYAELVDFEKEFGHCLVPARYTKNRRLGIFVSAQRQQYKARFPPADPSKPKPKPPLTDERIRLLNELNFTWSLRSRDNTEENWKASFEALKQYKADHGNLPKDGDLSKFVEQQKSDYKQFKEAKRTGKLTPDIYVNDSRIQLLAELGITVDNPPKSKKKEPNAVLMANTDEGANSDSANAQVPAGRSPEILILQEALERAEGA